MTFRWRAECKTCPWVVEPNYGAKVATESCEDESAIVVDAWCDEHLARFPDHVIGVFQTVSMSFSAVKLNKDVIEKLFGKPLSPKEFQ